MNFDIDYIIPDEEDAVFKLTSTEIEDLCAHAYVEGYQAGFKLGSMNCLSITVINDKGGKNE